jgi:hypothetical protein
MPQNRWETGYFFQSACEPSLYTLTMFRTPGQLDCNWLLNSNTGCGVRFSGGLSYGPDFNDNGGGW